MDGQLEERTTSDNERPYWKQFNCKNAQELHIPRSWCLNVVVGHVIHGPSFRQVAMSIRNLCFTSALAFLGLFLPKAVAISVQAFDHMSLKCILKCLSSSQYFHLSIAFDVATITASPYIDVRLKLYDNLESNNLQVLGITICENYSGKICFNRYLSCSMKVLVMIGSASLLAFQLKVQRIWRRNTTEQWKEESIHVKEKYIVFDVGRPNGTALFKVCLHRTLRAISKIQWTASSNVLGFRQILLPKCVHSFQLLLQRGRCPWALSASALFSTDRKFVIIWTLKRLRLPLILLGAS